jgi:hypothetical protein
MGRRGYPPEFRRKDVGPGRGRPITEVAQALGISDQSISPGAAKTASTAAWSPA